eukprot:scaffold7307_cov125-Isochrysis_galbana.AAC.11
MVARAGGLLATWLMDGVLHRRRAERVLTSPCCSNKKGLVLTVAAARPTVAIQAEFGPGAALTPRVAKGLIMTAGKSE